MTFGFGFKRLQTLLFFLIKQS